MHEEQLIREQLRRRLQDRRPSRLSKVPLNRQTGWSKSTFEHQGARMSERNNSPVEDFKARYESSILHRQALQDELAAEKNKRLELEIDLQGELQLANMELQRVNELKELELKRSVDLQNEMIELEIQQQNERIKHKTEMENWGKELEMLRKEHDVLNATYKQYGHDTAKLDSIINGEIEASKKEKDIANQLKKKKKQLKKKQRDAVYERLSQGKPTTNRS